MLLEIFIAHKVSDNHAETANRPLEDLDILFSSKSPLSWRAEREFIVKLNERSEEMARMDMKGEKVEVEDA